MLSYEGLFFEEDMVDLIHSLDKEKLPKVNDEIHCTFKYHPCDEEIFDEIVGKSFEVYLVGYGSDGNNSGFELLLPEELQKYYINFDEENPNILKTPHITSSLAEDAVASDTKKLKFRPLERPVKLIGRFGYWVKDENCEYLSYEPYNEIKKH